MIWFSVWYFWYFKKIIFYTFKVHNLDLLRMLTILPFFLGLCGDDSLFTFYLKFSYIKMFRLRNVIFIGAILYFVGLHLFYKGFMPSHKTKIKPLEDKDIYLPTSYTHLVIMVIDAFRADFIFSNKNTYSFMPFLRDKITSNMSYSYYSKTNLPTVTMPRIKSLTTGAASDFSDIFYNAASSELNTDNLIQQFNLNGFPIVFFGDNTWLRLFPNSFLRSDGTHSFYVSDYTEVDDNVTRHLNDELIKADWKVMILHYLGLDHIGHLAGPTSPLIGPKLQEMDHVIQKIYDSLKERDYKSNTKSLFLITGDHGMSDLGSHGGASEAEVLTPLVLLDPVGGQSFKGEVIKQVDIASTISALFNIPIPNENIGHPIKTVFSKFGLKERYLINQLVACQLLLLSDEVSNRTSFEIVKSVCNGELRREDFHVTEQLSKSLKNLSHKYSEIKMVSGLFVMLLGLIAMVYSYMGIRNPKLSTVSKKSLGNQTVNRVSNVLFYFQAINICFVVLSMGSTSFVEEEQYVWYYLTSSFYLLFLVLCKCEIFPSALFLTLLRVTHAWNRTGVKWTNLEDLSNWFEKGGRENMLLLVIAFLHVVLLIIRMKEEHKVGRVFYGICCSCLIVYHATLNGFMFHSDSSEVVHYLVHSIYLVVLFMVLLKYFSFIRHWKTVFIPYVFLFLQIKESPWFLTTLILEELFTKKLLPALLANVYLLDWQVFFLYFSMFKFSYFSQGNSNSLATIDFAAGMVGFQDYNPVISNIIIFFKTYFGLWLWGFSFLDNPVFTLRMRNITSSVSLVATLYQMLIGIMLSIIVFIQRYHLFIWSVYAPRYLYMISSSGIIMLFLIFSMK